MLQLQLQIGVWDDCDVIGWCVFGTHLTDGLTVSVSIWWLMLLITVCDLQSVVMPSFSGYFMKMTSIYFNLINSIVKAYHLFIIVYAKLYSSLLIWLTNFQILSTCLSVRWRWGCGHHTNSAVCPWRHRALTVKLAKTIWACQQLRLHVTMMSHAVTVTVSVSFRNVPIVI